MLFLAAIVTVVLFLYVNICRFRAVNIMLRALRGGRWHADTFICAVTEICSFFSQCFSLIQKDLNFWLSLLFHVADLCSCFFLFLVFLSLISQISLFHSALYLYLLYLAFFPLVSFIFQIYFLIYFLFLSLYALFQRLKYTNK